MSYFSLYFGGTHISICAVNGSVKEFINDGGDNQAIPSCMFYTGSEFICGSAALEIAFENPPNVLFYLSTLISISPENVDNDNINFFNQEIRKEGNTISLNFGGNWFTREELLKIYFQYLVEVIGDKANLEKGILAVDDLIPVSSYSILVNAAKEAGMNFLRIVSSTYGILAKTKPVINPNQFIIAINFFDDFTISIYDHNYKFKGSKNFGLTYDILTDIFVSIVKYKLNRGENKVKLDEYPEGLLKSHQYSQIAAFKILTHEITSMHIPNIIPGRCYNDEMITQTKVYIYFEEFLDNIEDQIQEFFENFQIPRENLVRIILLNHAKLIPYVTEFMIDKYEHLESCDYDYFTGIAEGTAIIEEDPSQYPNFIVQPNGEILYSQ